MGRGEKSLVCDPGSELRLGGREKRKAQLIRNITQTSQAFTVSGGTIYDSVHGSALSAESFTSRDGLQHSSPRCLVRPRAVVPFFLIVISSHPLPTRETFIVAWKPYCSVHDPPFKFNFASSVHSWFLLRMFRLC